MNQLHRIFLLTGLCAAPLFTGCGQDEAPQRPRPEFQYKLEANAKDDAGEPVPGLPVIVTLGEEEPQTIGYTDRQGKFLAVIQSVDRANVTLAIGPTETYQILEGGVAEDQLSLRREGEGLMASSVRVDAKVRSKEIEHLIWFSIDCGDHTQPVDCEALPIELDGEIIATTDPSGRAHFVHTGIPGDKLTFTINNDMESEDGELTQMLPSNPTYELELDNTSQVYVFKDSFSGPAPVKGKRAKNKSKRKKRRHTKAKRVKKPAASTTTTTGSASAKPKPKPKPKPKAKPTAKAKPTPKAKPKAKPKPESKPKPKPKKKKTDYGGREDVIELF